jgi:hypothetical protein
MFGTAVSSLSKPRIDPKKILVRQDMAGPAKPSLNINSRQIPSITQDLPSFLICFLFYFRLKSALEE